MIADILFWTLFGGLSGWIVTLLRRHPIRIKIFDITLGSLGGFIGGLCTRFLVAEEPELWILGMLGSLLGATFALTIYTMLYTKNNVI